MNQFSRCVYWIILLINIPMVFYAQETPDDFLDLKELIHTDPDKAIGAIESAYQQDTNPYYKYLEALYFSYQCQNDVADAAYTSLLEQDLSEEFKNEVYLSHVAHVYRLGYLEKARSMIKKINPEQIDSTSRYYPAYLESQFGLNIAVEKKISTRKKIANEYLKREHIPDRIFSLIKLAILYRSRMNQLDLGLKTLHIADSLAQAFNFSLGEGSSKHYLAQFSFKQGKYDETLKPLKAALEIRKKIKDKHGIVQSYLLYSAVAQAMGDSTNSKQYHDLAFDKATEYGLIKFQTLLLMNTMSNDLNLKRNNYEKSISLSKQMGNKTSLGYSSYNLGAIFQLEENYEKAAELYQQAYSAFEEAGSTANLAWLLPRISDLYIEWKETKPEGYEMKYNDSQLEEMLTQSLELSKTIKDYGHQKNVYESLIKFYDERNRYDEANVLRKEYIEIQREIFEKDRTEAASKYAAEFETAEKANQILQLESEKAIEILKKSRLKWLLIVISIFFALLASLGYYVIGQRNLRKQVLQRESFRSQLSSDLHDDVGTILSSVAMHSEILSHISDKKTKSSLNELALMSRQAMEKMRDTVWAIDSRKDKIIDLQDRMVDYAEANLAKKNISFKIDNKVIDTSKKMHPELRQNMYLIFKEAITNIIKYSNANEVKVVLSNEADKGFSLSIVDNGQFDASEIKTSGTGISNMKMRTEKFGGKLMLEFTNGFKITAADLKAV